MTREEQFDEAKKARKQQEAERQARKNYSQDYEEINYCALETGNQRLVRFLGGPIDSRQEGTDPKEILFSMILGDDEKKFRCIFPTKESKPNWILWKVIDVVLTSKYNKEKKEREYFNQIKHPQVFNRVFLNNDPENPYEKGWYPSRVCLINVIDREQIERHRELKHTFLLSKKMSEGKEGVIWYDTGIPSSCYKSIWDDIVEYYGDYEKYDIVIEKLNGDPYYKTYHALGDKIKIFENLQSLIVDGPLTEEELSWERYDFDKIYKVTSYQKILNRLGIFIQQVDVTFGKNFYDELKELAEEEKKQFQDQQEKEKDETPSEKPNSDTKPERETSVPEKTVELEKSKVEEPAPARRTTKTPESSQKSDLIIQKKALPLEGISKLSEEELSLITGITSDGKGSYVLSYATGVSLATCSGKNCEFVSPEVFKHCPKCGVEF